MLARMAARPRWLFWLRGSLLCALGGHWVANAFLDRDQFESVGLEYTWGASLPFLIQALLALAAVLLAGRIARPRRTSPARTPSLPLLLLALAAAQLALFLLLEVSERLVQAEPFVDGLFGSGFALELVLALASAVLLALVGSVAVRAMGTSARQRVVARTDGRRDPVALRVPIARPVVVVGRVRAPPPLPA